MILRCMVLHTGTSTSKTMCTAMVVVAIISLALTCIEFHTQSHTLIVVEASRAPIVLGEGCAFGLPFAGALLGTFSFSLSFVIAGWRERFRKIGCWNVGPYHCHLMEALFKESSLWRGVEK